MRILIVDDEALARGRLIALLRELYAAEHELLEADNGIRAVELASTRHPDTVLLDVRMPGMDGLETALHLAELDRPPAVIFTTAYEDHALAAFDASAVDYLLKPIRLERLRHALQKAGLVNRARITEVRQTGSARAPRTHIGATAHGRLTLIPVAEILYLKAGQRYVGVGWEGRELLIDESLASLEQEFGARFLRIHRSALIAPRCVEGLEKQANGGLLLRLRGVPEAFPVSRRHAGQVRKALRSLGAG